MNRRGFVLLTQGLLLDFLATAPARAARIEMMGPEESIAIEHQTRSVRLRRLVEELGVYPSPEFYEYVIPAGLMPSNFRHDTPVLRVVFPENTFFDTAKWDIVPSAWPIIRAMAKMLQGDVPDVAVFVAGHTDNRGSNAYNHNLAVERSRSVAQALRGEGADSPDIWSVGFGESLPLYANDSPTHMAYNRRVEFLFAAQVDAVANWLKDQLDLACSKSSDEDRIRCLSTLANTPKTFVVDPVEHVRINRPQPRGPRVINPQDQTKVVSLSRRQIVINLAEHTYVVQHPEG